MELNAENLTKWAKEQENYSRGPEFLPDVSPWGPIEFGVDEGRDRDYPSNYYYIISIDGRFFKFDGYYDSWNGVEWDAYDGWMEVEKKTKTEVYWG